MDKTGKFLLPSPKFTKLENASTARHFLSPQGIQLLTKEQQPPPMYGPRGSTVPPKFHNPVKVPPPIKPEEPKQKFFCKPCEAEFDTSADYKSHKSQHVQCEIDECYFRGHPDFMDTHIVQKHATGLYDQLKKLTTPEEIAQWRADRKKNYPTVASVEQKLKAKEQRMARGEKLELERKQRFGKKADRRQIQTNQTREPEENSTKKKPNKNRKKNQRNKKFEKKKNPKVPSSNDKKDVEIEPEQETIVRGVKMFKGTAGMEDYKKVKKPVETNCLSSLLGMYGSDSENESEEEEVSEEKQKEDPTAITITNGHINHEEKTVEDEDSTNSSDDGAPEEEAISKSSDLPDKPQPQTTRKRTKSNEVDTEATTDKKLKLESSDDEGPEEVAISKTSNIPDKPQNEKIHHKTQVNESKSDRPSESTPSDDEAPEETAIAKTTHIPDKPQSELSRKKAKPNPPKKKTLLDYRKLRVGRQNTMLEKLLDADIRHERNVLLQCVRFVVENNFFEKPKSA